MPRGGRRPGAGRKPGVPNKKTTVRSARVIASGDSPLDIMLASARALFKAKNYAEASLVASRAAPYIHQRFAPTAEAAKPHPEQKLQRDLFDPTPLAVDAADEDPWDKVLN